MKTLTESRCKQQVSPSEHRLLLGGVRVWTRRVACCLAWFLGCAFAGAQSPNGPVECTVQYQVSMAELAKCGFAECLHVDPPRVHTYHHQTTRLTDNYSYSWSGDNWYFMSTDNGYKSATSGPYSGSYAYHFDVTYYQSAMGTNCWDYTNYFTGGWSCISSNSDQRTNHFRNESGADCISDYYYLEQDSMSPAYVVGANGAGGWYFTTTYNGSGSITDDQTGSCDFLQTRPLSYADTDTTAANLPVSAVGTSLTHAEGIVTSTNTAEIEGGATNGVGLVYYTENKADTVDLDTEYTDDELRANILGLMPPVLGLVQSGWVVRLVGHNCLLHD